MERLDGAGFRLLPAFQIPTHYLLERDGFVALVERLPDGSFGAAGAPGLLVEGAMAMLVWKQAGPRWVAKSIDLPASGEQVESLRRFDGDLRAALGGR